MAVIYTKVNGDQITIGGTTNTGPFPKYSIEREILRLGDRTPIGNKYVITISGKLITDTSANITVSGEMQSNLHAKMITKLQTDMALGFAVGKLEITPYGGAPNTIEFLDAKLISVQLPEQADESSGILYSDYSFTFEANEDISNSNNTQFPFALETAEETWEISIDEAETTYEGSSLDAASRTYTITHSVSATGRTKFTSGPDFSSSAWKQALEWVKTRLATNPASAIISDAIGNTEATDFNPSYMDTTADIASTDISSMSFYNHTRTPNCDLNSGSYSITESWKASSQPALLEMDVSIDQDESQMFNMTLNGTITGLDSTSLNNKVISKLENAELVLLLVDAAAFNVCNSYYSQPGGTLGSVIRSKSIGRNRGTGTITFSYSYNDSIVLIENAISTSVSVTDDNEYRLNKIIAVIPIVAKDDGPIIQDMKTTGERKRSVQIDAVMGKGFRTIKPAAGLALALTYAPLDGNIQSVVENWESGTGSYSINVEWVY